MGEQPRLPGWAPPGGPHPLASRRAPPDSPSVSRPRLCKAAVRLRPSRAGCGRDRKKHLKSGLLLLVETGGPASSTSHQTAAFISTATLTSVTSIPVPQTRAEPSPSAHRVKTRGLRMRVWSVLRDVTGRGHSGCGVCSRNVHKTPVVCALSGREGPQTHRNPACFGGRIRFPRECCQVLTLRPPRPPFLQLTPKCSRARDNVFAHYCRLFLMDRQRVSGSNRQPKIGLL